MTKNKSFSEKISEVILFVFEILVVFPMKVIAESAGCLTAILTIVINLIVIILFTLPCILLFMLLSN